MVGWRVLGNLSSVCCGSVHPFLVLVKYVTGGAHFGGVFCLLYDLVPLFESCSAGTVCSSVVEPCVGVVCDAWLLEKFLLGWVVVCG